KPRRRNAPRARLTFSRLGPPTPARAPGVGGREGLASPPRGGRAGGGGGAGRGRAEEAGGLASRKPQKGSRPMAQAVVGEVARAPAVRRPSFSRASSPIRLPGRRMVGTGRPPPRG